MLNSNHMQNTLLKFLCFLLWVQIENEFGVQSKLFGAPAHNYMTWAANMAVGLKTGVPWVMCKEEDAPDPVVTFPTICKSRLPKRYIFRFVNVFDNTLSFRRILS